MVAGGAGYFADAGTLAHWCQQESVALRERARRPHIVAAMEAVQRERMAIEPGATR
jgi:hypothetical protein